MRKEIETGRETGVSAGRVRQLNVKKNMLVRGVQGLKQTVGHRYYMGSCVYQKTANASQ